MGWVCGGEGESVLTCEYLRGCPHFGAKVDKFMLNS